MYVKSKKVCKTDKYLDVQNFSFEKHLFSISVSECEDEIFKATATLLNDE